ncbi:MAG: glutamyl-tRNA reductase [bacterium]
MRLILVGLNHETAPVEIRERLAFSPQEAELALGELRRDPALEESLLLSTCNRTELVIRHKPLNPDETAALPLRLAKRFLEWRGAESIGYEIFYVRHDEDAVRHLFSVSAGLESMIVGEAQILAQVKEAYQISCRVRTNGFLLNKLMHAALRAGKRARSETEIGMGAVSISLAAVELSQKIFRDLSKKRALVIGAGEMARLTAEHFIQKNVGSLTVANRTDGKAMELAERLGGHAVPFAELQAAVAESDVVITSTGANEFILNEANVRAAMGLRQNKQIFLIDISVPRNIDPAVKRIYNVFAYDIDDLNQIVDRNLGRRRLETAKVEKIIAEEAASFADWHRSLEVTPTIRYLVDKFETVRTDEIKRNAKNFTPEQMETLDKVTQGIVNKILHSPIARLRDSGSGEDSQFWVDAVRNIFALEPDTDE